MYLIQSARGLYLFSLLESCLDFVLDDEFYVHNHPTILRLNGCKFEPFMTTRYRGNESIHHQDDKPDHCDVFTFDLSDRKEQRFTKTRWIDDKQNGMNMREVVRQYAIEIEEKQLIKENRAMEKNDLVTVIDDTTVITRYSDPDCLIGTHIRAGSKGFVLNINGDFVAVYFQSITPPLNRINQSSGCFRVHVDNLRIIGKSTPKEFFGHPIIDFKDVVGDSHGIWAK